MASGEIQHFTLETSMAIFGPLILVPTCKTFCLSPLNLIFLVQAQGLIVLNPDLWGLPTPLANSANGERVSQDLNLGLLPPAGASA